MNPAFAGAIGAVFDRSKKGKRFFSLISPRTASDGAVSAILETHDPRHVSHLVDAIRGETESQWAQRFGRRGFPTPASSHRFVRTVLAVDPDAAFPLTTFWEGYVREAAVRAVREIPGPFCLALLIHRTNDWVAEVRDAAETKLAALVKRIDRRTILGCIELLFEFERYQRVNWGARETISRILSESAVVDALRSEALGEGTDRAYRILRLLLRTPHMDEVLERISTNHGHPNARALALGALLQGEYDWIASAAVRRRPINVSVDKERLVRKTLHDRAPRVQLVALRYVAINGLRWADAESILLPFSYHRSSSLSEMAQWGLKTLGVDWIEKLRRLCSDAPEPNPRIAATLAHCGNQADGESFWYVAKRYGGAQAIPFLAAAAQLKNVEASDRLNAIIMETDDLALARRASNAILRAGIAEWKTLERMADRGDEFFARGLGHHFRKLRVVRQLIILCRLERSGADFDLGHWFAFPIRKLNRGAFAPTVEELRELNSLFALAPRVRDLSKRCLAIG